MSVQVFFEIERKICKIVDTWRASGVSPEDALRITMYLLALKKVLRESDDSTWEETQTRMAIKDCMYDYQVGVDVNLIFDESRKLIEKKYHLQSGFFQNFFDNVKKIPELENALTTIFQVLRDIPYVEDKKMSAFVASIISNKYKEGGYINAHVISNQHLAHMLQSILDVQNGDRFCDGTIGYGISAIKCIENTDASLSGMDINFTVLQMATLFAIISGRKNFEMKAGDFTLEETNRKYNKIAMEIPFALKTGEYFGEQIAISDRWLGGYQGKELDVLIVGKILDVLEENGRAAIVVPNSFLVKNGKANKAIREMILEKKLLKAVIGISALFSRTSSKSSILLIEKNDDKILFINVDRQNIPTEKIPKCTHEVFAYMASDIVSDILKERKEEKGISALVDAQQLKENKFDFSPSRYTSIKKEVVFRDIQTINNELGQLYDEFKAIQEENRKFRMFN